MTDDTQSVYRGPERRSQPRLRALIDEILATIRNQQQRIEQLQEDVDGVTARSSKAVTSRASGDR